MELDASADNPRLTPGIRPYARCQGGTARRAIQRIESSADDRARQPTTPRAFSLVHTTVDGHGDHVGGVTRIMNLAGGQKGAQRERPSGGPRSTAGVQPLASAHYGVCAGAQWAICIYCHCE